MECNKDEATRARDIAERKFHANDIPGAKKFALKALALYPGLEGISQLLQTLDVYICAESETNGEPDWYGILGLTPLADDKTVKQQYRKLALSLHPDKNKSVGGDGAFKLISEAWHILSDKTKKLAYDQRRSRTPSRGQTAPPGFKGFYDFAKSATSSGRSSKNTQPENTSTPHAAEKAKSNSFWTICHRCKMRYEYLRTYLGHNLICPTCRKPFLAIETPCPVSDGLNSSIPWNTSNSQRSSYNEVGSKSRASDIELENFSNNGDNNPASSQWTPFSGASNIASSIAHARSVVQQTYEKVKQDRKAQAAHKKQEKTLKRKKHIAGEMGGVPSFEPSIKKRRGVEEAGSVHMSQSNRPMRAFGVATGNPESSHMNSMNISCGRRDLSQFVIREMLMEKAKNNINKKISQWKSNIGLNNTISKERADEKALSEENRWRSNNASSQSGSQASSGKRTGDSVQGSSGMEWDKTLGPLSITVPDPDFYDFDKRRTDMSFEENQVWAAYDDDDGMPRYYAIIHHVISRDPFKVRISWLNSRTNTELSSIDWVGCGFAKTCGDFRVGRHETNDSLNSFSHKIWWTKCARGVIRIYPRKGDVWALYRNWSPVWDELTPNEIIHKYDVVEVLGGFDEALGVVVTPLVKVAGFKTVFRQHMDQTQVRRIPREEMFRFSHQIPWHLITAQEAPDTLKGCMELDPAATPADFLQVIGDVNENVEDVVRHEEKMVADSLKKDDHHKNLKVNYDEERRKAAADLTGTKVVELLHID